MYQLYPVIYTFFFVCLQYSLVSVRTGVMEMEDVLIANASMCCLLWYFDNLLDNLFVSCGIKIKGDFER